MPKMIYMDLNEDVNSKNFDKIEEFCSKEQWKIYKSNTWTRKGNKGQKDTNIDVIFTHNMNKDNVAVKFGEHNK